MTFRVAAIAAVAIGVMIQSGPVQADPSKAVDRSVKQKSGVATGAPKAGQPPPSVITKELDKNAPPTNPGLSSKTTGK